MLRPACALVCAVSLLAVRVSGQPRAAFPIEETTIAEVHAAMRAGSLTCRVLVQQYLQRIEAYDKRGPAINAVVVLNPRALAQADELDRRFTAGGLVGPLHCVPAIVKDNFETIGSKR